ncbi:Vacuolar protein 8, partial [Ascosphaera acerosa]
PSSSPSAAAGLYEPVLDANEREAVADLLEYLENRSEIDFYSGPPLAALTTLVYSDNVNLQRSASLTFAEITERGVHEVARETLEPILFLLQSPDTEVQRAASAALGNLAVNNENKLLIVQLGGLPPLINQMRSENTEVQCNAVGCITNLATHEENKGRMDSDPGQTWRQPPERRCRPPRRSRTSRRPGRPSS